MRYDADAKPVGADWLAQAPNERREAVGVAHERLQDVLHPPGRPVQLHVGMHVTVEDLCAEGHPVLVATLERLCGQGMRRHAAVHMAIDVLMARFVDQMKGEAWSDEAFDAALQRLDGGDWIGRRMRHDLGPVDV